MTDTYLFVGDHADTLSSGRRVAPGDSLLKDDLDLTDGSIDKRFMDQRLLVKQTVAEPAETGQQQLEPETAAAEPPPDDDTPPEPPAEKAEEAEEAEEQPAAQTTSRGGRAARTTSKEKK